MRALDVVVVLACGSACVGAPDALRSQSPSVRALRGTGLHAPDDLTVHGSRTMPLAMNEARWWGVGAGGGARAIVAGERILTAPDGSMAVARDRLPGAPSSVLELPERLGGGFVFALPGRLLRSDTWLGRADAIAALPGDVAQVVAGLDRLYVSTRQGAMMALDPRAGAPLDFGPLPASPNVSRLAALDGWRAIAIADMRGVVLTVDAGATWRPVRLPLEPSDVVALDDSFAVTGLDPDHQVGWWEVRPDGAIGRLPGPRASAALSQPVHPVLDAGTRAFGARPLIAALEDGWPLTDGTALVARDGVLGRVRLTDGSLVETAPDAFPLAPARCHAFSLARRTDPGAFGYVCGEARGRTILYRWHPGLARLVELRRFDVPRQVLGFGNGALAVRGPCGDDASAAMVADEQAYCILFAGGSWREVHFRGEEVDRARLVVLGDDRMALVRPPHASDLSTARLTITDGEHSAHLAVKMPAMRADVARAVRTGLWLDGFEERREGVIGGWVDSGGAVLGVEIALDGAATVGTYTRGTGEIFVSGRWGFGWTASRRGIETTDGGMSWKEFEMPDPLAPARAVAERACGPIGCLAAGWMRVGWGEPASGILTELAPPRKTQAQRAAPEITLECEALADRPPEPVRAAPPRLPARAPPPILVVPRRFAGGLPFGPAGASSDPFAPFGARPAPVTGEDDARVSTEVSAGFERTARNVPYAAVYGWGPKDGDWDQLGRWQVRWLWPYGGWPEVRSSSVAPSPWATFELARHALGRQPPPQTSWLLAPGDDADHALLVARRTTSVTTADVIVLENDRAPVEVHRSGGDSLPDIEGAVRAGGRWYLATVQPAGELAATVVWLVDGTNAREVGRVPRIGFDARPPLRMAHRSDNGALGLVVDGQLDIQRGVAMRWVVPVDLESGKMGEPEPLAPSDLADRRLHSCTAEDTGWEVDLPYSGRVVANWPIRSGSVVQAPIFRLRLGRESACIEQLMGSVESSAPAAPPGGVRRVEAGALARGGAARPFGAALMSARLRYPLRCSPR
jgi:hypothetical protein